MKAPSSILLARDKGREEGKSERQHVVVLSTSSPVAMSGHLRKQATPASLLSLASEKVSLRTTMTPLSSEAVFFTLVVSYLVYVQSST